MLSAYTDPTVSPGIDPIVGANLYGAFGILFAAIYPVAFIVGSEAATDDFIHTIGWRFASYAHFVTWAPVATMWLFTMF